MSVNNAAKQNPPVESENVSHFYDNINLQDWFFDIIINFLRSPRWKAPIMSYLDENCILFDSEDENKLEYTSIHNVSFISFKLN